MLTTERFLNGTGPDVADMGVMSGDSKKGGFLICSRFSLSNGSLFIFKFVHIHGDGSQIEPRRD